MINTTADHIKDLLKAEEQGRLVVLPCAVGDTIWVHGDHCVLDRQVEQFVTSKAGVMIHTDSRYLIFDAADINKTWFTLKEEAEAAMEQQKKNCQAE